MGENRGARIYVGNLNDNIQREDLEQEFMKFGKLNNIWVAFNPPGFAFIEFENRDDAEKACEVLNGNQVLGSRLRVEMSKGKRPRQNKRGGGGRNNGRNPFGGGGRNRDGGGGYRSGGGDYRRHDGGGGSRSTSNVGNFNRQLGGGGHGGFRRQNGGGRSFVDGGNFSENRGGFGKNNFNGNWGSGGRNKQGSISRRLGRRFRSRSPHGGHGRF